MKEKKEYYGIYINGKIPIHKEKDFDYYNVYNTNIKLKFEGKAYLIEDNEKIKKELKDNGKIKKDGNYTIKLINEKNEIYYINIKIKKNIFVYFFLILFFIILFSMFYEMNNNRLYKIGELSTIDINFENSKYIFNVNYDNSKSQEIKLCDTIRQNSYIYPGSNGTFYIVLNTKEGNKEIEYLMQVEEENNKPKNLKFELNNKTYNSMEELAKEIKGTIKENSIQIFKIQWYWKYQDTSTSDDEDTKDGKNIEKYKFKIKVIGNEKNI